MLKAEEISKSYGDRILFNKLSFCLNKRERCALVGRNGCGKSTLLRILMGLEPPDEGAITRPKNYHVGYLEQHIVFSEKTLREEAALALPEEEREAPYKVEAILSGLGFQTEDFEKSPNSFSGGYQLRIQLAKTLAKEPDCLLLDEPTNYLDIISIRWLEKFLKNWRGEIILISHDRAFLDAVATHTMGLHREKLVRVEGTTANYYNHILLVEESYEKSRQKVEKQKEHAESFIRRFGAKATKAKQANARKKALERLPSLEKLTSIAGLDFEFKALSFTGRRLVEMQEASFKFPSMTSPLINNLSIEIQPQDRIAIIGKNGRGKSTLLRMISGDLKSDGGVVQYADNVSVGFFGQTNIQRLDPELTIEETIRQSNPSLSYTQVRNICGTMMFSGKAAEKKVRVLSGGEKSRVLLGKILASPCNLLLLDEPSNHLDIESVEALIEALEQFQGSVVIVSHEEEILKRVANRLIICQENNQQVFEGDYEYFLEKMGWEEPVEKKAKEKSVVSNVPRTNVKKQIEKLETAITQQEQKLSEIQQELVVAIEKQDRAKIASLTQQMREAEAACSALYLDLEQALE